VFVEGRDTNWILTEKQVIIRVNGFPYLVALFSSCPMLALQYGKIPKVTCDMCRPQIFITEVVAAEGLGIFMIFMAFTLF